jgi:hypothetical protein
MKTRLMPYLVPVAAALTLAVTPPLAAGLTAGPNASVAAADMVPPTNDSAKTIRPDQDIVISATVARRAPPGWFWWFSVLSLNTTQRGCATFAYKVFKTRGSVGQTLRAKFAPEMDTLRDSPRKWCSGRMVAEAQIDSYSDRNFKHSRLVAVVRFRIL